MSDIPLECTPHYVRIRCFLHEDEFLGSKTWSEWSQLVSVPGKRMCSLSLSLERQKNNFAMLMECGVSQDYLWAILAFCLFGKCWKWQRRFHLFWKMDLKVQTHTLFLSMVGYRDLGSEPAKMFPQDKVVPVGTNVTFCCVHKEGERVTSLDYGECSNTFGLQDSLGSKSPPSNECPLHQCQFSRLTNWSLSIYVPNASCVRAGGINAWCISETPPVKGTVLFIGCKCVTA